MSGDSGLAACGTEFDPVETVVSSEESIRDSLDFQEEYCCEGQVEDDDEPDNSSSRKMAASPVKSNGVSDSQSQSGSAPNGYRKYLTLHADTQCRRSRSANANVVLGALPAESAPGTPAAIGHKEFWDMFTGLKVKQYSDQELEAFKGPFLKGWRREVVLRGTVTNSGKKIGDVYYYSPDKKTKLRSYVEMGLFLKKNSGCGLEPENFTFARQPVYKPPEEIVRHAMTRGSNQPVDHFATSPPATAVSAPVPAATAPVPVPAATPKPQVVTRRSQSNASSADLATPETPDPPSLLQQEGRSKRKRVAPTRFEDEEYLDNSPFKKKTDKPVKSEKTISPLVAAAAPANTKTIETKVNAQGRTSIIIRTPIRKAAAPAPASDSKPQIQVQNPVSATVKPADVKEQKDEIIQVPAVASVATTDCETTAIRSEERLTLKSEPDAEPPVHVNGSLPPQPQMNLAPPPLQPIRISPAASPAPVTPQTVVRKEARPAAAPVLQQQNHQPQQPQNTRKASNSLTKSSRSILTPNATQFRIVNEQGSSFKPIRPKPTPRLTETADGAGDGVAGNDDMSMVPPCSIMCGGGQLPSLLCSRCLCLFHPQCVQRGIHLIPGNQFVCPNCIQPSDQGRAIGLVNGGQEESGGRTSSKTQSSSRNSSRGGSPLHSAPSLIRNQQLKSSGLKSHQQHPNQAKGTISTMMDKRQQSQMQLLQTFQQVAGIRFKGTHSSRPVISRPIPPVKKQQIVQNRGHLRLSAAATGRESRPLFPQNQNRIPKTRDSRPQQPQQQQAAPASGQHQHLSELISHHLDSVSKLLQEITMLKYSNCQKVSQSFLNVKTHAKLCDRLPPIAPTGEKGHTLFDSARLLKCGSSFRHG